MRRAAVTLLLAALVACSEDGPRSVELTAYPVRVLADGREPTTLTATVRDGSGDPVADETVTIEVTGSDNRLRLVRGVTDEQGVVVASLRSTVGELKTVTASTARESTEGDVSFTPLPPCSGIPRIGSVPAVDIVPYALRDFDEDGPLDVLGVRWQASTAVIGWQRGFGDGTFAEPVPLLGHDDAVAAYHFLGAADIDHDDHVDILVTDFMVPTLTVLRGVGDGTAQAPIQIALSGTPRSFAFADFDRDGTEDIAVGTFTADQQHLNLDVLYGRSDGTYDPYVTVFTVPVVSQLDLLLVAGDLDGDQRSDLVAWEYVDVTMRVLFGSSARTFTAGPVVTGPEIVYRDGVDVADVNGDQRDDLVVHTQFDGGGVGRSRLAVFLGRADRTLPGAQSTWPIMSGIAVADLDNDGVADLARDGDYLRGNGDGTFTQGQVYAHNGQGLVRVGDLDANDSIDIVADGVFLNDGGVVRAPVVYDDTGWGMLYAVGHVDRDGIVDIIHGDFVEGLPPVFARRGRGDGTFEDGVAVDPIRIIPATGLAEGSGATLADLDRDGYADLITVSVIDDGSYSQRLTVQLGNGDGTFRPVGDPIPAPGIIWHVVDLDNDGKLDIGSGTSVLPGLGNGEFGPPLVSDPGFLADFRGNYADVDSDGILDLIALDAIHSGRSAIYRGKGDGTFHYPVELDIRARGHRFVVDDLDNDGDVDLVAVVDGRGLGIFRGHGDGTFGEPEFSYGLGVPRSVVDMNRDGILDFVSDAGTVSLGEHAGGFGRSFAYVERGVAADVDSDGMIDLLNGYQFARQQGCSGGQ